MLSSTFADLEALACLRAVQFAVDLGLQRVIFEGDSTTIISAVSQGTSNLSSFVIFSHVNCSGNIVADALAKRHLPLLAAIFGWKLCP